MYRIVKTCLLTFVIMLLSVAGSIEVFAQKKGKKEEPKTQPQAPKVEATEADALFAEGRDKWGKDSLETVKNYSLYREYAKQKLYNDALPYWRYVIQNAPKARKTPYIDGEKMYKAFFESQIKETVCKDGTTTAGYPENVCQDNGGVVKLNFTDEAKAYAYLDTIFQLYDMRGTNFNETGYMYTLKARTLAEYKPHDNEAIVLMRQKAVLGSAEDTEYDIIYQYFKDLVSLYNTKVIKPDSMFAAYDKLIDAVNNNVENNEDADAVATYKQVQEVMENWKERVDAASSAAIAKASTDCPTVLQTYGDKYRANPNDLTTIKQVYSRLKQTRCTDTPLYFEVLLKWQSLEPSASQARFIAQQYQKRNEYGNAIKYYNQSIELETDPAKQAKAYMQLAKLEQVVNSNFSQARKYAKKAADLQPGSGEPYLFIGDLYMRSKNSCSDDGLDGHSVYWVAADMYAKAKEIDPSVAARASEKINACAKGFPNKENLFFKGYNIGGAFTVRCWIQQNTYIR